MRSADRGLTKTRSRPVVQWTRAVLGLLAACSFLLMPLSMAQGQVAAMSQSAHGAGTSDHCAGPETRPRENPLLAAEICAIACSAVLPAPPPFPAGLKAGPAPVNAGEPRSLHGIAIDICPPPPRSAPEA